MAHIHRKDDPEGREFYRASTADVIGFALAAAFKKKRISGSGLTVQLVGAIKSQRVSKVVDVGPIHASRDKIHTVPVPPIAGALALIGGVALLVSGKNN